MNPASKLLVPAVSPVFKKILSLFPEQYFRYVFAYGSGVFDQGKATGSNPMIDLIFSVDDSAGFHRENMLCNPSHYSALSHFGHNVVAAVQEKWPARVYFNTLVPLPEEGIMFKYGVVKHLDLINDLFDWDYLYLAGRLHKPVLEILPPVGDLRVALRQNLYSALHSALLLLPSHFTERQLYITITTLSYNGDFRMVVGEDKNKITNIVDNQIEHFRRLYIPYLLSFGNHISVPDGVSVDRVWEQDSSYHSKMYHLFQLPKTPTQALTNFWHKGNRYLRKDAEDVFKVMCRNPDVGCILEDCLKDIVFKSSWKQSLKGIFTAGIKKSLIYSNKKISKMRDI